MTATAVAETGERARAAGASADDVLVSAVRAGDDRAFEELYERYNRRIGSYVYGMVGDHQRAEDVTQEVFFSALRRMRDTERPIAFRPWIYEIARNACIDQHRRTSRAEEVSFDVEDDGTGSHGLRLASAGPTPEDAVSTKQELDHLCGAFGGLSEAHHQILVLRELEGHSYREIGERMGMSRAAVESTLFRARRRLSAEYDDLASGQRCARVQSIISSAAEGMLSAGDRRRLARHVSYCQPCRRHARVLGVEPRRAGLAARIAALIPLPIGLRRRAGLADSAAATAAHPSGLVAQLGAGLGAHADALASAWGKAAAVLAAVAIGSAGAGMATDGTPLGALERASDVVSGKVAGHAAGGTQRSTVAPPAASIGASTVGPLVSSPAAASFGTQPTTVQPGAVKPAAAGHGSRPAGAGDLFTPPPRRPAPQAPAALALPQTSVTIVPSTGSGVQAPGGLSGASGSPSVPGRQLAAVATPRISLPRPHAAPSRPDPGSAGPGPSSSPDVPQPAPPAG